jgi:hypothetical protein
MAQAASRPTTSKNREGWGNSVAMLGTETRCGAASVMTGVPATMSQPPNSIALPADFSLR